MHHKEIGVPREPTLPGKKQTPLRVWECLFLCKHKQKWEQAEILFCNFAVFAFGDMSRGCFFTG